MPFFQYTATDKQGRSVQGTVQASTAQEAASALARGGLMVSGIADTRTGSVQTPAPPPQTAPPPVRSAPPAVQAPQPRPIVRPAESPYVHPMPTINSLGGKNLGDPRKTRWGSDKDLYFIFSQLSSYVRSGAGIAIGASNLANTHRRPDYRESLALIAKNSAEGNKISDTLELFPFLYPPHVIGMVRAGEIGGYLPEALEAVSGQAMNSIKFRRWFVWLGATTLMVVGCLIVMQVMLNAAIGSIKRQDQAGGTLPGFGTLFSEMGKTLLWPMGPFILVLLIGIFVGGHLWQSTPFRRWRHRMALLVPSTGKRARAEAFAAFSWNMAMLSKSGIPPRQVWKLAAATMPNMEMRHQMELESARMTDTTKLSESLARTKTVPDEYAPMVQTGEITGDIPGQLLHASRGTQQEFETHDKFAKGRVGCWMLLVMAIGSVMIEVMYTKGFMSPLIKMFTEE
jgi:type II secretory pathway component PulF